MIVDEFRAPIGVGSSVVARTVILFQPAEPMLLVIVPPLVLMMLAEAGQRCVEFLGDRRGAGRSAIFLRSLPGRHLW